MQVTYLLYGVHASEKHSDRVKAYLNTNNTKPGYEEGPVAEGKPYTIAAEKFEDATRVSIVPSLAVPEAKLASNIA